MPCAPFIQLRSHAVFSLLRSPVPSIVQAKVQQLEGEALVSTIRRYKAGVLTHLFLPPLHAAPSNVQSSAPAAGFTVSYADSGVSIDAGNMLVDRIKPVCKATMRPGCVGNIGGFGGLFSLAAAGLPAGDASEMLLVGATDGVGTKLMLAERANKHDTIGQDLVAMCVNDIIVQGAEPLFFLDYFATGKLDISTAAAVVSGIAKGCSLAGCALIGGETAEMPQMYDVGKYDLAGFSVGAVRRNSLLPRASGVEDGDVLLGLSSSGVHSNGFSLVRRLVEVHGLDWNAAAPFPTPAPASLCEALLTPTRIYVKSLLALLRGSAGPSVRALCHITGGGQFFAQFSLPPPAAH